MIVSFALVCCLAAACLPTSESALAYEIQDIRPGSPEVCMHEGVAHRVGNVWEVPNKCFQLACEKHSSGQVLLRYASCGVVSNNNPRCRKVQDFSKPYPKCCPTIQCG